MVAATTAKRRGVQGLAFLVYVYDDHSVCAVTRRDYLPLRGVDLRLGHWRIGVGRNDLQGLSKLDAVRAVTLAIAAACDTVYTAAGPGSPGGGQGGGSDPLRTDTLPGV